MAKRRFAQFFAGVLMATTGVVATGLPAQAAEQCIGTDYECSYGNYGPYTNTWADTRYFGGQHNCARYAAYRLAQRDVPDQGTWGDAKNWDTNAPFPVNGTPAVGAIAQWNEGSGLGSLGHVAHVDAVGTGWIEVSDDRWGSTTRRGLIVKQDDTGYLPWPDNFIHVADIGGGTASRLVGNVNGDGRADAVVMFKATGTAMVALSTGTAFGYPGTWSVGHSPNASRYMLGDVTGDGMDDLVAFYSSTGTWKVSVSSGSGFWAPTDWAYQHGPSTTVQWVADATGDGRAEDRKSVV